MLFTIILLIFNKKKQENGKKKKKEEEKKSNGKGSKPSLEGDLVCKKQSFMVWLYRLQIQIQYNLSNPTIITSNSSIFLFLPSIFKPIKFEFRWAEEDREIRRWVFLQLQLQLWGMIFSEKERLRWENHCKRAKLLLITLSPFLAPLTTVFLLSKPPCALLRLVLHKKVEDDDDGKFSCREILHGSVFFVDSDQLNRLTSFLLCENRPFLFRFLLLFRIQF